MTIKWCTQYFGKWLIVQAFVNLSTLTSVKVLWPQNDIAYKTETLKYLFQLINGSRGILVKLIVQNAIKHCWMEICRPIDQTYWLFPELLHDVSTMCPLTEMWGKTLSSVTVSFPFWGRELPLLTHWSMMHAHDKLCLSTGTNAPTPSSANVSPV